MHMYFPNSKTFYNENKGHLILSNIRVSQLVACQLVVLEIPVQIRPVANLFFVK